MSTYSDKQKKYLFSYKNYILMYYEAQSEIFGLAAVSTELICYVMVKRNLYIHLLLRDMR